ncbi:MAG: hypothetical protein ACKER6_01420 [Candidatus Hodgkinia cicadicola]
MSVWMSTRHQRSTRRIYLARSLANVGVQYFASVLSQPDALFVQSLHRRC